MCDENLLAGMKMFRKTLTFRETSRKILDIYVSAALIKVFSMGTGWRAKYNRFEWAGETCPRFVWAGGTFSPVVLLCQFLVLAGNRVLVLHTTYVLRVSYHTVVVLC